jgi:hypothetical protein
LDLAVVRIHTINTFRTEKYSRILTLNIYLNIYRRGHERTWFSNIIYSAPPEIPYPWPLLFKGFYVFSR